MENDDLPVGRILSRREILSPMGLTGAAVLAACATEGDPAVTAGAGATPTGLPATEPATIAATQAAAIAVITMSATAVANDDGWSTRTSNTSQATIAASAAASAKRSTLTVTSAARTPPREGSGRARAASRPFTGFSRSALLIHFHRYATIYEAELMLTGT